MKKTQILVCSPPAHRVMRLWARRTVVNRTHSQRMSEPRGLNEAESYDAVSNVWQALPPRRGRRVHVEVPQVAEQRGEAQAQAPGSRAAAPRPRFSRRLRRVCSVYVYSKALHQYTLSKP